MAVGDFDYDSLEGSHYIIGPLMFWIFIVLVYFILMSVFIALIAEAYEAARDELELMEEARTVRTPATGDRSHIIKSNSKAQKLLRELSLKNMVSNPLAFSLGQPLQQVDAMMKQQATLLELSKGLKDAEADSSSWTSKCRPGTKVKVKVVSVKVRMPDCRQFYMRSCVPCRTPQLSGASQERLRIGARSITDVTNMVDTWATVASESQSGAALAVDDGLSHPIDTFTDDDGETDHPCYLLRYTISKGFCNR